MMWMVWLVVAGVVAALLVIRQRRARLVDMIEKQFHGPRPLPLLGNSLEFACSIEEISRVIDNFSSTYARFYRVWFGTDIYVVLYRDKDVETVLSSHTHTTKSDVYRFTVPWIGNGLLVLTGSKWKTHRRIISPSFNSKILEGFCDIFNQNGQILCEKLEAVAGKAPVDIYPFINLFALDNVCETGMGTQINAQINAESAYVRATKDICKVVIMRMFKPWLMNDFIFNLSTWSTVQKKALGVLHGTTKELIKKRKEAMKQRKAMIQEPDEGEKRRLVFLDVLLESGEGETLTDEEIRVEVDSFMFAGHDTVTSAISFTFYSLATNPHVQEEVYVEQVNIFGDSNRDPSYKELHEMKYLDRVLKEAQRLYPSIPFIARKMEEPLTLSDGIVIPKGANTCILITALHKDPTNYPNPQVFNPDNFLPEAISKRSPYAFVPFSAGPRICIGQRFALLQMKSVVSKVVRKFKLSASPYPEDKVRLVYALVTGSANGVKIVIEPRP